MKVEDEFSDNELKLADPQFDVYEVPMGLIYIDPDFNCRSVVSRTSVKDLADSIRDDGLLIPVIIQPSSEVEGAPSEYQYRLVCGFRRFFACQDVLRRPWIEAYIRVGLTEDQAKMLNFQENLARHNLNIVEEARGITKLFPDNYPSTRIAEEISQSANWVRVRRNLFKLPKWIIDGAESGLFKTSDIKAILSSQNPEWRATLIQRAVREGKRKDYYVTLEKRTVNRKVKTKDQIRTLAATLLDEGFDPMLCRLLGWCSGDVSEERLEQTLTWLRDRKGWLK